MIENVRNGLRRLCSPLQTSRRPASIVLILAASASVVASPPNRSTASAASHTGSATHWYQIGKASWYGRGFQGKRTATGERFDMNALTCAHRTLPLGSWLRVTNLRNRRSTFVRVNDRGPYENGTLVDLSYAAAQRIGLLGKAAVRVEQVSPNDPELAHALVAQLSLPDQPFISPR